MNRMTRNWRNKRSFFLYMIRVVREVLLPLHPDVLTHIYDVNLE